MDSNSRIINDLSKIELFIILFVWITSILCVIELIKAKVNWLILIVVIVTSVFFVIHEFFMARKLKTSIFLGLLVLITSFTCLRVFTLSETLINKLQGEWLTIDEIDTLKINIIDHEFLIEDLKSKEVLGKYRINQSSNHSLLLFDEYIEINLTVTKNRDDSFKLESDEFVFDVFRENR